MFGGGGPKVGRSSGVSGDIIGTGGSALAAAAGSSGAGGGGGTGGGGGGGIGGTGAAVGAGGMRPTGIGSTMDIMPGIIPAGIIGTRGFAMLQLQWHWLEAPKGHWTFPCRVNRVASMKFRQHSTAATDRTPSPTCCGMVRKTGGACQCALLR